MGKFSIFVLVAFSAMLFSGPAVGGVLPTDDNAYNDGTGMVSSDGNPFWRGSVLFYQSTGTEGWNVNADVEYAVYAPGMFASSEALGFPTDPSGGADWVYAYQVINNAAEASDLINAFTVGLDGDEGPNFIGFIDGSDVNPSNSYFVPAPPAIATSAKWDFQNPNIPSGGTAGDILFFTVPFGPETDDASVQGALVVSELLPSPVPEPATISLLLAAVAMLGLRRGIRS